jgi:hypothetical protein
MVTFWPLTLPEKVPPSDITPVKEVVPAAWVIVAGFADQSHFTRQFHKVLQVTPGQ